MKIYDMLINRALNGGSGGGGSGGGGDGDAYAATVTFAVRGSDWIGVSFNAWYSIESYLGDGWQFGGEGALLSAAPAAKLPLLTDTSNSWALSDIHFWASDGETQLQGELSITGGISQDMEILGDCTVTLIVGGQ